MNSIPVKRRKSGFTLIELLVVIAIIAILAAILFPVFARARENARRASCQSNEKNIALGFKQYIQDNGEKYPPEIKYATDLKVSGESGALSEYIKSGAIFICPSDSVKTGSYGYRLNGQNESSLEPVSERVLLKETSATRHFGGQNIAFADGHVKWGKSTGEYGSAANGALQPAAPDNFPYPGIIFTTYTPSSGPAGDMTTCRVTDPRCPVAAGATNMVIAGSGASPARDVAIEWAGKDNFKVAPFQGLYMAPSGSATLDLTGVSGDFEVTISPYAGGGTYTNVPNQGRTYYFTKG